MFEEEGRFIRLARIILILLVVGMAGRVLAENAADEEAVDSGTMDLITEISGTYYVADQSVVGTGFANTLGNFAVVDPVDKSQVLDLRVRSSGSGYYSHNSAINVINNSLVTPNGDFEDEAHSITAKEDTSAVYAPVSIQFPGSFEAKAIKSLWRDQTYSRNYAGMITMDSLYDYAKTLNKESTTTMYSDEHKYQDYLAAVNSTTSSSMDINSKFDGSAHLGVTLADVRGGIGGIAKSKADSNVLMDEDYKGSFSLTKKMAVSLQETTDYGDYDAELRRFVWRKYAR